MVTVKQINLDYDTVVVEPQDRRRRPRVYKYDHYTLVASDDVECMLHGLRYVGELEPSVRWSDLHHFPKASTKTDILHQFCMIELGKYDP